MRRSVNGVLVALVVLLLTFGGYVLVYNGVIVIGTILVLLGVLVLLVRLGMEMK